MLFRAWAGAVFVVFAIAPGCGALLQLACVLQRHRQHIHPKRFAELNLQRHRSKLLGNGFGNGKGGKVKIDERESMRRVQTRLLVFVAVSVVLMIVWATQRIYIIQGKVGV